jgi:hypothetical protein
MMLSQRDCRPRALPGVTCAAAGAVSARLIGAATQVQASQVSIEIRAMPAAIAPASDPLPARAAAAMTAARMPMKPGAGSRRFAVFVQAAHDRGHGGIVESGKRRPLHEGAEHVGAVDDPGSQHAGEAGDGCEQAHGSLLDGAPLVRPAGR